MSPRKESSKPSPSGASTRPPSPGSQPAVKKGTFIIGQESSESQTRSSTDSETKQQRAAGMKTLGVVPTAIEEAKVLKAAAAAKNAKVHPRKPAPM